MKPATKRFFGISKTSVGVAESHSLGLIVGNVNEGGIELLTEKDYLSAHLVTELGVEVGKRLVHKEHLGMADHGAADGDALALASGEGAGLTHKVLGYAEDLSRVGDLIVDLVLGPLLEAE